MADAHTRKSCKTLTHDILIKLVQTFAPTVPKTGICEGFTSMWIQALLTGKKEEAFFYQRLDAISDYLKNHTPETLKKEIDAIYLNQLNQSNKLPLLENFIKKTEIRAFAEAIAIHQAPITISCEKFLQFDKPSLYPLTYSQKLEQQKTILHTTCLGALTPTRNELTDYLTNIQSMIIAKKTVAPIAFFLHSDDHSTGFYFDKDSSLWHYLEINQLDKKETYYTVTSSNNLANLIFDSFEDVGDYSGFSITGIYTDTNNCAIMNELNTITLATTLNLSAPDRKNSRGCTALWLACRTGSQPIVDLLLKKGAITSINTPKNNGSTPLYIACAHGHQAVVALLLENGAITNINTPCNDVTPLYIACQNGRQVVVALLLEKGALNSINTPCNDIPPLLIACQNGHQAVVALLLEKGANIDGSCNDGTTALWLACQDGHQDVAALLLEKGASINTPYNGVSPLWIACQEGHQAVVTLLLAKGANVNTPDDDTSPLYIACQYGHQAIVALLLENGAIASINTPNNSITPLFIAFQNNQQQKILLDKESNLGADARQRKT